MNLGRRPRSSDHARTMLARYSDHRNGLNLICDWSEVGTILPHKADCYCDPPIAKDCALDRQPVNLMSTDDSNYQKGSLFMSYLPGADPTCNENCPDSIEMAILPRTSDIGNFEVQRVLPFRKKRMVGPFIFWDQMGPGEFLTNQGLDVRPHPHIGLSTVTYLLDGSIDHRDSLGFKERIFPGDVNLMTAGSGIVHSERTGQDVREAPSRLFGIQSWLAQPKKFEGGSPDFKQIKKKELPTFEDKGIHGRVIFGDYCGTTSPTPTQWDTLYVDLTFTEGSIFKIPATTEERAIYTLTGTIIIDGTEYPSGQMLVLRPGKDVTVQGKSAGQLMILGGAVMDGPRYIFWNFVSSDKDQIVEAKRMWNEKRFPVIQEDPNERMEFS